jgi:hypothetical protein
MVTLKLPEGVREKELRCVCAADMGKLNSAPTMNDAKRATAGFDGDFRKKLRSEPQPKDS